MKYHQSLLALEPVARKGVFAVVPSITRSAERYVALTDNGFTTVTDAAYAIGFETHDQLRRFLTWARKTEKFTTAWVARTISFPAF